MDETKDTSAAEAEKPDKPAATEKTPKPKKKRNWRRRLIVALIAFIAFVVIARLVVPLFIPAYPLPAILAAMVLDGADQTIFAATLDSDLAGYQTYGFTAAGTFPEVVDGILHDPTPDYPGAEFYLGGKIVKDMPAEVAGKLAGRGVTLDRDPRKLLATAADAFLKG